MKLMTAICLASVAGTLGAQQPAAHGMNFYSVEKEKQLGQTFAANLEKSLPMVHEPKLDAYVAKLGAALAQYAESPFDYTFQMYEDRSGAQVTPMAPPRMPAAGPAMPVDAFRGPAAEPVAVEGGAVFIPMSLLASAPDEAVFAFQLAHAMAHVARRHPTQLATRSELIQISQVTAPTPQTVEGANRPPVAPAVGTLAFARAAEREADYWAVQMVSKAGYNPEAIALYLGEEPKPKEPNVSAVFAVRPPPGERAKAIRAELEKLPAAGYTASTGDFDSAKALAGSVR